MPKNLCAHREGAIEELIKDQARHMAAQPEEVMVKLLSSFKESLSQVLMGSCEGCRVSQISNQVRSPIGDQRLVDTGESSKRRAANDLSGCCKRRCTDKHDQGCQATKPVQRIQEAPHIYPTTYFGHHTSPSLNNPSQNPLLEAHLPSFSSKTITPQDSEPYSLSFSSNTITPQDSEPYFLSFSSKTISTPYTSPCPSSASFVRKECGEETVQSNSLSGDLPLLPPQRPQPMISFSQGLDWIIGQWGLSVLRRFSFGERRLRRQRLICGTFCGRRRPAFVKMLQETC